MTTLNPIFSVSEFNQAINQHLGLVGELTVEGELSELKVSHNKWVFGTIKDDTSSVEIFAFAWHLTNLNSLEPGMLVQIHGTPGIYQKSGRFRLNAQSITPAGAGALALAYQKLKNSLEAEGLFDPARKRPLPMFPQKIGLVTAKNSQAYQDFIKVTAGRIGGLHIIFFPVTVQGDTAIDSLTNTLKFINHYRQDLDLVVITRGGGSLEDLIAFNHEQLVRSIYASKIPVVAAIGHEGDVTLAELAADLRASTPSNAAELITRDKKDVLRDIDHSINRIHQHITTDIASRTHFLHQAINRIDYSFTTQKSTLESLIDQLSTHLDRFPQTLAAQSSQIDQITQALTTATSHWLHGHHQNLDHYLSLLHHNHPRQVLKQGYTLTQTKSGHILTNLKQAKSQSELTTQFHDGTITSTINKNSNSNSKS